VLTAFLQAYFPNFVDYSFTSTLEAQLDEVSGVLQPSPHLSPDQLLSLLTISHIDCQITDVGQRAGGKTATNVVKVLAARCKSYTLD